MDELRTNEEKELISLFYEKTSLFAKEKGININIIRFSLKFIY